MHRPYNLIIGLALPRGRRRGAPTPNKETTMKTATIKHKTVEISNAKTAYVRGNIDNTKQMNFGFDVNVSSNSLRELIQAFFSRLAESYNAAAGKECCAVRGGYVVTSEYMGEKATFCLGNEKLNGREIIGDLRVTTLVRHNKSLSLVWDGETNLPVSIYGQANGLKSSEKIAFTDSFEAMEAWWFKALPAWARPEY